jgi:hypothetical protein
MNVPVQTSQFLMRLGWLLVLLVVLAGVVPVSAAVRTPNDPEIGRQWALNAINAYAAWATTTGDPLVIAVVDTGISPTHLDLKRKLLVGVNLASGGTDARDDEGHGTLVAGIAAAESNNGLGVAGACWGCRLLPVKVANQRGGSNAALIAAGIRYAADQKARIINVSLGVADDTPALREATRYAQEQGALVVAAAGNRERAGNPPYYPAAYPGVLAVGALGRDQLPRSYSTSGPFVGIAAPGEAVLSTYWKRLEGDGYAELDGTSAAAALVSGAAALVWSVRPDLSYTQVAEVLQLSAADLGAPGRDEETGYGLLNLERAVLLAQTPDLLQQSVIQGFVRDALPEQVVVTLNEREQATVDASGFFRFGALGPGRYTVELQHADGRQVRREVVLSGTALNVVTLDLRFTPPESAFFQPVAPPTDPNVWYFSETGHTLTDEFRRYWETHGGLPVFGFPISEPFRERDAGGRERRVQYFERHRFELHPENAVPYNVLLTRLGDLVLQQRNDNWATEAPSVAQPGCLFFAETRRNLCEPFLSAWRANGLELDGVPGKTASESLALFGQPLGEVRSELLPDGQRRVVQWFERARFEDHGAQGVLFGLLSREYAINQGLIDAE